MLLWLARDLWFIKIMFVNCRGNICLFFFNIFFPEKLFGFLVNFYFYRFGFRISEAKRGDWNSWHRWAEDHSSAALARCAAFQWTWVLADWTIHLLVFHISGRKLSSNLVIQVRKAFTMSSFLPTIRTVHLLRRPSILLVSLHFFLHTLLWFPLHYLTKLSSIGVSSFWLVPVLLTWIDIYSKVNALRLVQ